MGIPPTTTTTHKQTHTNSKLNDRAEIEQTSENKSNKSIWGDPKTVFESYPNPKNSPLSRSENSFWTLPLCVSMVVFSQLHYITIHNLLSGNKLCHYKTHLSLTVYQSQPYHILIPLIFIIKGLLTSHKDPGFLNEILVLSNIDPM